MMQKAGRVAISEGRQLLPEDLGPGEPVSELQPYKRGKMDGLLSWLDAI